MGEWHAELVGGTGHEHGGGADIAPEARAAFEEPYDAPTYESHEALFEAVDAAVIATPNRFHEAVAVDAFEADANVLIEKPLANDLRPGRVDTVRSGPPRRPRFVPQIDGRLGRRDPAATAVWTEYLPRSLRAARAGRRIRGRDRSSAPPTRPRC